MRINRPALLLFFWVGLSTCVAQDTPWQTGNWLTPVPKDHQILSGSAIADVGESGIDLKDEGNVWGVIGMLPGGPGDKAGLAIGDFVITIDGSSPSQFRERLASGPIIPKQKPGERHLFRCQRGTREYETTVTLEAVGKLYPKVALNPPAVMQTIFGETDSWIMASVKGESEYAQLSVQLRNNTSTDLAVDEAKFFMLDGNGQPLLRPNLSEIKYSFDLLVATYWQGEQYPLPPPPTPSVRYKISTDTSGNYLINQTGPGWFNVTGQSQSSSTVRVEPDTGNFAASWAYWAQRFAYSVDALKYAKQARQYNQALSQLSANQKALWEQGYFRSSPTIAPRRNRQGTLLYWAGVQGKIILPLKAVFYLTNPETLTTEAVSFEFR